MSEKQLIAELSALRLELENIAEDHLPGKLTPEIEQHIEHAIEHIAAVPSALKV